MSSAPVTDRDPAREGWLQQRRQGIGASDIAAVVGLCDYGRTPLDIYLQKKGILQVGQTEAMYWGHVHEPNILQRYAQDTGLVVARNSGEEVVIFRHKEYPWCMATPDGLVYTSPEHVTATQDILPLRLVEAKAVSQRDGWGTPGTDEVPRGYLLQCQWQLLACSTTLPGVDRVDLAVLIAGNDFRIYTVRANLALQEMLLEEGERFWRRVEHDDPPPIEPNHERAAKLLGMLYAPVEGSELDLAEDLALEVEVYEALGKQISELTRERDEIKAKLLQGLGTHEEGRLPDGRRLKHSHVQKKTYTVEAHTESHLRILKARKK